MDGMNRMEINTRLKAQQPSITLSIGVCKITFFYFLIQTMGINIVVYPISEECHLCRHIF